MLVTFPLLLRVVLTRQAAVAAALPLEWDL